MKLINNILRFFNKNSALLSILVVVGILIWGIVDRGNLKAEIKRLEHNNNEWVYEKLGILSDYRVSTNEMAEFINRKMPDLEEKLDSANLKIKNIQQVVVQKTIYIDTTTKTTDLRPVLEAIQSISTKPIARHVAVPVVDESPCLLVRGLVTFDGESLELTITERKFTSINEVVTHITRNQWRLLGIPTRLFGKKKLSVTVFNSCGESTTTVLTKKGGKWLKK